MVRRLDDHLSNTTYRCHRAMKIIQVPENFKQLLNEYVTHCVDIGNSPGTIKTKKNSCIIFLNYLVAIGCKDISQLTVDAVSKDCFSIQQHRWVCHATSISEIYLWRRVDKVRFFHNSSSFQTQTDCSERIHSGRNQEHGEVHQQVNRYRQTQLCNIFVSCKNGAAFRWYCFSQTIRDKLFFMPYWDYTGKEWKTIICTYEMLPFC